MAKTAAEQSALDVVRQQVAEGTMSQEAYRNLQKLFRQNEKARKAEAARERMKDILSARLLDLFPIDYDRADLTEVGQAKKFAHNHAEQIRYTDEYGWLIYEHSGNGGRWTKNALEQVKRLYHDFNDDQVHEALNLLNDAPSPKSEEATQGERLLSFSLRMRTAGAVNRILDQAKPYVITRADELDADPYMLNTPSGLYDLRTGKVRPSRPHDLCCHMTAFSAQDDDTAGAEMWLHFLAEITQGDKELENYLQAIIGRAAFGIVKGEELMILYGNGSNGKSTFMNTIAQVMADYAITFDGETLMDTNSSGRQFDLARLHGARLAVFTELKENRTLDTATLKHIASTDRIHAAIKYQMPFDFAPSHSAFLYSNHLPRVYARDDGTWRRLVVCPFNARFSKDTRKLNYAEELTQKAGGYIMAWIIQGAMVAAANAYKLDTPESVSQLIAEYRRSADWLTRFLDDYCEQNPQHTETAANLYATYLQMAQDEDMKALSKTAFNRELEKAGFTKGRTAIGMIFQGLQLKPE